MPRENPNILLIVMDSVRAQNTSLHGYERETTPFLSEFADESTVYEQARAPGEQSITSHASIFTGHHVLEHALTDSRQQLATGHTIWSDLAADGYRTAAFSNNPFLAVADVGLDDGFETVYSGHHEVLPFPDAVNPREYSPGWLNPDDEFDISGLVFDAISQKAPVRSALNGISLVGQKKGWSFLPYWLQAKTMKGSLYTELFTGWLDNTGPEPWAACINYMDAHTEYLPDKEHNLWASDDDYDLMNAIDHVVWEYPAGERSWDEKQQLERLYDGCIHQVDSEIQKVVRALKERGEFEDTLIVITSDHGEGFGEPSEIRDVKSSCHGCAGGPEEELLHVPLVAKFPRQTEPERIPDLATPRAFPHVVKSSRDGSVSSYDFIPDTPVISYTPGIDPVGEQRAGIYLDDLSQYRPECRIAYDQPDEDNTVQKSLIWDEREATVRYSSIYQKDITTGEGGDFVGRAFSRIQNEGILSGDEEELNQGVKDRLEDLGYA